MPSRGSPEARAGARADGAPSALRAGAAPDAAARPGGIAGPEAAPADPTLRIGGRQVGPGHPCLVIAEIAQAHDGSLGAAHAYVDAAAGAGAHAVKFQTHIARAESTAREAFRVPFSRQDATRYDYWRRMEFAPEQWAGLAAHARERGLVFLSSAFSEEACDLLEALDVPAWKVGSGEVGSRYLVERMARTGRPVLLSSGLATWQDLDAAVGWVRDAGASPAVFQCTSQYPCPPERWNLGTLAALRERYRCPVGLSDHSGGLYAGLAAVALGADLLEVHLTFSRECFGPDVPASVTPRELARLVEGADQIRRGLAGGTDKETLDPSLRETRMLFSKSIVAARDLPCAARLAREDVAFKKPGGGLPPSALGRVLGRSLRRSVAADGAIREEDLE